MSDRSSSDKDVIDLINKRLDLGKKRYGHGVKVDADTTEYGTNYNDWCEMAMEELLDGIVYVAAEKIRSEDRRLHKGPVVPETHGAAADDNNRILNKIKVALNCTPVMQPFSISYDNGLDEILRDLIKITHKCNHLILNKSKN